MRRERRWWSAALVRACFLVTSVLSPGCAGIQSALHPAGPQATHISHLWWLMFWVCTGIFVIVMGLLLYAVWHPRQQDQAATAPETERRTARVVVAAVVMTGLVLFIFLIADFWTTRALAALSTSQPLKVKITGHQWWWDVEYEATVPSQRVTTANELHVPVGRPVLLELTSHDVIHSTFSGRPVFGYTAMVLSLIATGFIGCGLWVHHMFATGLPQLGLSFFTAASMMIAIPSGIQIFCWIATLWHGRPRLHTPLLFVLGLP